MYIHILTEMEAILKGARNLGPIIRLKIMLYHVCRKGRKDSIDTVAEERWLGIGRN
jgi:hypothetical protein